MECLLTGQATGLTQGVETVSTEESPPAWPLEAIRGVACSEGGYPYPI